MQIGGSFRVRGAVHRRLRGRMREWMAWLFQQDLQLGRDEVKRRLAVRRDFERATCGKRIARRGERAGSSADSFAGIEALTHLALMDPRI
jgi:hypothetical protein